MVTNLGDKSDKRKAYKLNNNRYLQAVMGEFAGIPAVSQIRQPLLGLVPIAPQPLARVCALSLINN
jgi:hypothetical protein